MGGNGRFWAVWGGMAAGAVVVGGAAYRPLPPVTAHYRADIHTEYVKFPSGRDTITAYLAYPERKDPAPVVVVIHERSEEHTSELQSHSDLVCRLLLEKKKNKNYN